MATTLTNLLNWNFTTISHVNKFGYNPDADTAAEDVWDAGGVWVGPTVARVHDIVSTSIADDGDPAGTGALTVKIFGLDSDWLEQSEIITMDGTTPVETASEYIRIFRMQVLTVGSGGVAAGNITATAQTDSTVTAQITAGQNQTLMAIYTIPAGKVGYMANLHAAALGGSPSGLDATVRLLFTDNANGYPKTTKWIGSMGRDSYDVDKIWNPFLIVGEKTDIVVEVTPDANNASITSSFDIILVDSDKVT